MANKSVLLALQGHSYQVVISDLLAAVLLVASNYFIIMKNKICSFDKIIYENCMTKSNKRTTGLTAIVIYKTSSAILLAITSIALLLAIKNSQFLATFSEEYALTGKREIIKFLLKKITSLNPKTLQFSAAATGIYSVITAVEAIGLWYQKAWAKILVLVLVGIGILPEMFELYRGLSMLKLVVLVLNIVIFWYLLSHSISDKNKA